MMVTLKCILLKLSLYYNQCSCCCYVYKSAFLIFLKYKNYRDQACWYNSDKII